MSVLIRLSFTFCTLCLIFLLVSCPIAYAKSGTTWKDVGAKFLELEKARSQAIEAISKKPEAPTLNLDTSVPASEEESNLEAYRSSELNQKPNKSMKRTDEKS
ncbi:hypothetical protein PCC8801_1271 [Rippkaea orientalis PCC 8801]|uniref:Uncharacterized protein n=1 Tax=Rippkaea orientalis (strain PCC 8801 / RF-1) TaxID=41431 RepID=B7K3J4_RIPO1|nr:hypothetical protein [Rippkaea orientalis]ACK65336.1 hypothetical protein PCC8801_1271 [Rippkaea orientalis PCC 8801]